MNVCWPTRLLKKQYNIITTESRKNVKSIFLWTGLCDSVTMVFLWNSSTVCTTPQLLYKLKVLKSASNHLLKNYGLVCNTIFYICKHAHIALHIKKSVLKCSRLPYLISVSDYVSLGGKLQLKYVLAAKRWHKQDIKNIMRWWWQG